MEWLTSPEAWIALTTLTLLEIVLGVDNIIFISILVGRLPEADRQRARVLGLGFAMGTRILLLLVLTWIMRLQATLFTALGIEISGRDLILIGGGLFLLAKATLEIHESLEGVAGEGHTAKKAAFLSVIIQIALIDIVFSLDSVITAVGLADDLAVMIIAIVIAVGVMMVAAGAIGRFVDDHPTVKMLALSFLVLIWRPPADGAILRRGMEHAGVAWLREALAGIAGEPPPNEPSMLFDAALEARVRDYQRERLLDVDGIVGTRTHIALAADAGRPDTPHLAEAR
jgi:predicted tellurium resistance membrane protein TerC